MSDLIKKADVIGIINEYIEANYMTPTSRIYAMRFAIQSLPSAEAPKPAGEWVRSYLKNDMWHCTVCDAPIMTDDISEMKFCSNCGARMKGGAE